MRLVEETIDRPKRYRPSSLQEGLRPLINQLKATAHGSTQLLAELDELARAPGEREEPQVRLVVGIPEIRRSFLEALGRAKGDVWAMVGRVMVDVAISTFSAVAGTVASRRLRFRAIVEVGQNNVERLLKSSPLVDIRHHEPTRVHLFGIDDQCVSIGLVAPNLHKPESVSALVITHRECVEAIHQLYNALWNQAKPLPTRLAELNVDDRHIPRRLASGENKRTLSKPADT